MIPFVTTDAICHGDGSDAAAFYQTGQWPSRLVPWWVQAFRTAPAELPHLIADLEPDRITFIRLWS